MLALFIRLITPILLLSSLSALGQAKLNLSFDSTENRSNPLVLWHLKSSPNYKVFVSPTFSKEGTTSLCIDLSTNERNENVFVYTRSLPINELKGKIVQVSIWVKGMDFKGVARLYASVMKEESGDRLFYVASPDTISLSETWTKLQIQVPINKEAERIAIGIQAQGKGIVYADAMEISTGGIPYLDEPLAGTKPFLSNKYSYAPFDTTHIQINSLIATQHDSTLLVASIDTLLGQNLKIKVNYRWESKVSRKVPAYIAFLAEGDGISVYNERYKYYQKELTTASGRADTLEFEVTIPNTFAKYVAFGLLLNPGDTICLSDIKLMVNQKELIINKSQADTLDEKSKLWLQNQLISLKENDAAASQKLLAEFKTAKIVGLGEVTHGSHEIFKLKADLIKKLVEHQGFRSLLFEADIVSSMALNRYLLNGEGDIKVVLKGLGYWTWNTREILELLEWIRKYNTNNRLNPVRFYGIDIQPGRTGIAIMEDRFKNNPVILKSIKELSPYLKLPSLDSMLQGAVMTKLNEMEEELEKLRILSDTVSIDWMVESKKYISILKQYFGLKLAKRKIAYRDAVMAENVETILASVDKAIVWSHNSHVSKVQTVNGLVNRTMGGWLKQKYKADYVSVGFLFGQGSYRALYGNKIQDYPAKAAANNSFEFLFSGIGQNCFFLKLNSLKMNDTNQWLFERKLSRLGGAEANDYFERQSLINCYDAILFIRESSPAQGL